MFTYVGLFRVAPMAREHLEKTPVYFDKIHKIVEDEGGTVERFLAIMGPWEYVGIFEYPDLETAFRVLGKIAKLEVFETETFPAEDVKVFLEGARLAPDLLPNGTTEAAFVAASVTPLVSGDVGQPKEVYGWRSALVLRPPQLRPPNPEDDPRA